MSAAKPNPNMDPNMMDLGERKAPDGKAALMTDAMNKMTKNMDDYRKKMVDTKSRVTMLKALTEQLAAGYKVSVQMVLDLSGMLNKYIQFIDNLQVVFSEMEKNTILDPKDLIYVKQITQDNIVKLQEQFKQSMGGIIDQFKQNNMLDHVQQMETMKTSVENIYTLSKTNVTTGGFYITQEGGIRYRYHKKSGKRSKSQASKK